MISALCFFIISVFHLKFWLITSLRPWLSLEFQDLHISIFPLPTVIRAVKNDFVNPFQIKVSVSRIIFQYLQSVSVGSYEGRGRKFNRKLNAANICQQNESVNIFWNSMQDRQFHSINFHTLIISTTTVNVVLYLYSSLCSSMWYNNAICSNAAQCTA